MGCFLTERLCFGQLQLAMRKRCDTVSIMSRSMVQGSREMARSCRNICLRRPPFDGACPSILQVYLPTIALQNDTLRLSHHVYLNSYSSTERPEV